MNKLKSILIGFGKIAAGYAKDSRMCQYYTHATHIQVLRDHPDYDLQGIVDPSERALESAQKEWKIKKVYNNISDVPNKNEIDVLVIASPPGKRQEVLNYFKNLSGLIVEKPLGLTTADSSSSIVLAY